MITTRMIIITRRMKVKIIKIQLLTIIIILVKKNHDNDDSKNNGHEVIIKKMKVLKNTHTKKTLHSSQAFIKNERVCIHERATV